uniref:Store-operated calcium entry-associated regulatory factor n=1 Tax=Dermatophagoides pteronyssinus TaxID=6956 RepID=A0A6P6XRM0_DERPT|nr:store-operated calcium entry-associated regulatory factor-like [Dermatophagoides pteronyssinus]
MLLIFSINLMMINIVIVMMMVQENDRILLKNIDVLTFESGRLTKTRRNQSIQQLTCDGRYCNRVRLKVAQCFNLGSNGQSIEWECRADMPYEYRFRQLNLSCEGYDSPKDEYVLADSCGLQYTIKKRFDTTDDDNNLILRLLLNTMISIIVVFCILFFGFCCCFYYRKKSNPNVNHIKSTPRSKRRHRKRKHSPKSPRISIVSRQSFESSKSLRNGKQSPKSPKSSVVSGLLDDTATGNFMGSNKNATISPNIGRTLSISLSSQSNGLKRSNDSCSGGSKKQSIGLASISQQR